MIENTCRLMPIHGILFIQEILLKTRKAATSAFLSALEICFLCSVYCTTDHLDTTKCVPCYTNVHASLLSSSVKIYMFSCVSCISRTKCVLIFMHQAWKAKQFLLFFFFRPIITITGWYCTVIWLTRILCLEIERCQDFKLVSIIMCIFRNWNELMQRFSK